MLRSWSFWVAIFFILIGIGLMAALGALHWLLLTLLVAALAIGVRILIAAYSLPDVSPPPPPAPIVVPDKERRAVVLDCDITMGRPFRDVADGLALFYLLGEPHVDLLGVTTTYGNAGVDETTRTLRRLLGELDQVGVSTWRGAAGPDVEPERNEAAQFLVETVNARPGEVNVVATGAMINLKHALDLDASFFLKVNALFLLGGMLEPIVWNGHHLAEINFSHDPEAAYQALRANCPIVLAPGDAGLTALFRSPQFARLAALDDPVSRLLVRKTRLWFALMRVWFGDDGFAMWDSIAAVPMHHPELFDIERVHITSTRRDLEQGHLFINPDESGPVRLIRGVRDQEGFMNVHFEAWRRLAYQAESDIEARSSGRPQTS